MRGQVKKKIASSFPSLCQCSQAAAPQSRGCNFKVISIKLRVVWPNHPKRTRKDRSVSIFGYIKILYHMSKRLMCLQYNWTIKLSAKSTRGSVRLIRNFLGPLRQSHQFLWPIYISGAASYLKVLSFQTGYFPFRLKIAISHSFFPPITSAQGLTQNRIWFLTNLYSWVSLLSRSFNITNRLFPIQTENSYFTLFSPPITSAQGLTQSRIWFWTNLDSWVGQLSWNFNITNELFPFQAENSFFTPFFPPITSVQGLTQCRI